MAERMTNEQAVILARAIRAGWPHQKLDSATVDVWAQGLRFVDPPLRFEDCEEALYRLVSKAPFSGPEAIVTEVKRIRGGRLAAVDDSKVIPNVDPDKPALVNAEVLAIRAAIADGRFDADAYASSGLVLSGAPARKAIGSGQCPPDVDPQQLKILARRFEVRSRVPAVLPSDHRPVPRHPATVRAYTEAQLADQRETRAASLRALQAMPVPADTRPVDEITGGAA